MCKVRRFALCVLTVCFCTVSRAATVQLPGFSLTLISDGVSSNTSQITQLAFKPGDDHHLYAARLGGTITRYDYDVMTGELSNAEVVASGLDTPTGLAFYGDDLLVSQRIFIAPKNGSRYSTHEGRISRLSDNDSNGSYETSVDFVRDVDLTNQHNINQLQVVGHTLYSGVGTRSNEGRDLTDDPLDPGAPLDEENDYNGTAAWIQDLTKTFFDGTNQLAADYLNGTINDGKLRYYAGGLRNPYGVAVDSHGAVWFSDNGASDRNLAQHGYEFSATDDLLYQDVQQGDIGEFPPNLAGTLGRWSDLGVHTAPGGLDFIPSTGDAIVSRWGTTGAPASGGNDVVLVDRETGLVQLLVTGMSNPLDVVADPFGRLVVSDFGDGKLYLLTPPPPGDFDGDGDVDHDDLHDPIHGWEARFGADLDGAHFLDWQRNSDGGLSSLESSTVVPEPATLVLMFTLAGTYKRLVSRQT